MYLGQTFSKALDNSKSSIIAYKNNKGDLKNLLEKELI